MYGSIKIRGARENNLKNVSLDIPKRKITVFTGVSGSGKSSLVFGTIAAESQRLINETYPAFVQQFMPHYGQPDAESLENISAAIIVDQQRLGGNSRSTVATVTDAAQMLRVVFSRLAEPHLGSPGFYSYNDPRGLCSECEGIGQVASMDMDAVIDKSKSLNEGAILPKDYAVDSWYWAIYARSGFFDVDKKLSKYTKEEMEKLLHLDDGRKIKLDKMNLTYEGLVPKLRRTLGAKDPETVQPHVRAEYERIFTRATCPSCKGGRLNQAALGSHIQGKSIAECSAMQVSDLAAFVRKIAAPSVGPMLEALAHRLDNLVTIGLGYLSLDRESSTLSGGESQRVKMVRHLGSSLTDVTYIFDEPSVGLHPHDVGRLAGLMQQLRDKGNTVLIVEHKPDMIAIADHVVDMGPKAGNKGGQVVFEGTYEGLLTSGTLTGNHMKKHQPLKTTPRKPTGQLQIKGARLNNLQDLSVSIPRGVLTVVTGVAGSGKSSLIQGCLPKAYPETIIIDQNLARGSRRSNTATYTGILDNVRKAFAKANKVDAALFSANSKGACPDCSGLGVIYTDLAHLDPMVTVCETCEGKRFTEEVLAHRLRGKSISDVYEMAVSDAVAFFTEPAIAKILQGLDDVGLGYLTLGQPLSTLSGGERQRLKLAAELGRSGNIYVLDEPTTGLHMNDVDTLIGLFDRLVDAGSTVIVIEHNLDVVSRADWVIDLGPGAGHEGGQVVFEGLPAQLAAHPRSLTGQHMARRGKA
ncbi:nogalamycin resistance protein SnorO [Myxococcus xanthus DK 1622]|uniref:UvrABC system protein A n=1 Tax=Myxococcus xanthus (strain DK1622) TaxID=246197 RepID=Q1D8L1_MYXXD|nr:MULTISPECIES: excinuclease ABC subunit UvrA [Myxococcus]ABF88899.1 nogalamycin resistance protein SnorO [Myxococcus xanthus DK 1622]NOJ54182.1 excinuclease ABC subunit UvrA [Myxococcus xanthus]QPM82289.1 excinuclease ABC subunit UvrA [Myxococcus xanthus]QVW71536.1 excinuclease ABC subunit UvrA [Myxococcus xanthus DZ2]QZZ50519.1 UvrABC system protein A [Myxococcus xanthus]